MVGKGTICVFILLLQSPTEFNTHNPHDVKGEMTPATCPLVSTQCHGTKKIKYYSELDCSKNNMKT